MKRLEEESREMVVAKKSIIATLLDQLTSIPVDAVMEQLADDLAERVREEDREKTK